MDEKWMVLRIKTEADRKGERSEPSVRGHAKRTAGAKPTTRSGVGRKLDKCRILAKYGYTVRVGKQTFGGKKELCVLYCMPEDAVQ